MHAFENFGSRSLPFLSRSFVSAAHTFVNQSLSQFNQTLGRSLEEIVIPLPSLLLNATTRIFGH
jgi:hypothetical protein